MAQETNQSQTPLFCTTGCGFYGNPRNNSMCSVCYKDFLQRQNSNGCTSPQGSSTDCSVGESLLAQCSDSSIVPAPTAISHTDTTSGKSSSVSTTSATSPSENESASAAKACPKTEDLLSSCISVTATAVGGGQEDQSSAAGISEIGSPTQNTLLTSLGECSCNDEKKLEDSAENVNGQKASVSADSVQKAIDSEEKPKAKRNRCFACHKKTGLTGFSCRCGNVFCSIHRYSDTHSCTFDYKADAAEKIRKENPVIVGEKIQKI
ncbi:AN1-type zinc finger protein 6 isoform X2 [Lampris incognitus]|nr:AN1-type zinc finger protein 6 isoform X2 [Lampris incognitus]